MFFCSVYVILYFAVYLTVDQFNHVVLVAYRTSLLVAYSELLSV